MERITDINFNEDSPGFSDWIAEVAKEAGQKAFEKMASGFGAYGIENGEIYKYLLRDGVYTKEIVKNERPENYNSEDRSDGSSSK